MIGKTLDQIQPGDVAEITRRVEPRDIRGFVDAVGDLNPLHSDGAFAARTPFGEPIAPGVFTAGMISAVIGTRMPGPGAVYISQTLRFLRPVKAGDTITARVEVLEVVRERNRMRLSTVCRDQQGQEVLSGEAWVMPSRIPLVYAEGERRPSEGMAALQPWAWVAEAFAFWGRLGLSLASAALPPSTTARR